MQIRVKFTIETPLEDQEQLEATIAQWLEELIGAAIGIVFDDDAARSVVITNVERIK